MRSALRAWAPGRRRECSLNFHSAPCIAVQRDAKFGGALPQPFVCLADRTRPMWIEFRVSVIEHCQRFSNCLGLAIPARRMDHCFGPLFQYLRASTKRASPCERYWTRHSVKTSTKSGPAYNEKLVGRCVIWHRPGGWRGRSVERGSGRDRKRNPVCGRIASLPDAWVVNTNQCQVPFNGLDEAPPDPIQLDRVWTELEFRNIGDSATCDKSSAARSAIGSPSPIAPAIGQSRAELTL